MRNVSHAQYDDHDEEHGDHPRKGMSSSAASGGVRWGGLIQILRDDCKDVLTIDTRAAQLLLRVQQLEECSCFDRLVRLLAAPSTAFTKEDLDYLNSPLLDQLHTMVHWKQGLDVRHIPSSQFSVTSGASTVDASEPPPTLAEAWTTACSRDYDLAIHYLVTRYSAEVKPLMDRGLLLAAVHDCVNTARTLLDFGAQVNADKHKALLEASRRGHTSMVSLLLVHIAKAQADPSVIDRQLFGRALRSAARGGQKSCVTVLLDQCPDLLQEPIARTIIDDAASAHAVDVLQLMFDRGLTLDAARGSAFASMLRGDLPAVQYLRARGVDAHITQDEMLEHAAAEGHAALVQFFLQQGADVHANAEAALLRACFRGHVAVVKLLLQAGANVHHRGDEPLMNAVNAGAAEVVSCLLEAGADVHANKDTALFRACEKGLADVADILLAHGADATVVSAADLQRVRSARSPP